MLPERSEDAPGDDFGGGEAGVSVCGTGGLFLGVGAFESPDPRAEIAFLSTLDVGCCLRCEPVTLVVVAFL